MAKKIMKLLFVILALLMMGCECPYLEERTKNDYEYYHQTGQDRLYADKLPGLWQCYYPMIIDGVEFKEMRIFSNGNADIIMEDVGALNTIQRPSVGGMTVDISLSRKVIPHISSRLLAIFSQNFTLGIPLVLIPLRSV